MQKKKKKKKKWRGKGRPATCCVLDAREVPVTADPQDVCCAVAHFVTAHQLRGKPSRWRMAVKLASLQTPL